jgi:hypothetical protein
MACDQPSTRSPGEASDAFARVPTPRSTALPIHRESRCAVLGRRDRGGVRRFAAHGSCGGDGHANRGAAAVIATIAVVFALEWAQLFVITLLLGLLFAYTLNPLVVWLEQIRIPRVVGSTVVMAGVVCALTLGAYSLRGQFQTILDQVPEA